MESWKGKAACIGQSQLFDVADSRGDRDPLSGLKWKAYDREKFDKAIAICRTCPVQQECGDTAQPEDWQWTVRAGKMPAAFNTRGRGRPSINPAPISDDMCGRGHTGRMRITAKGRRCYACEDESRQSKRKPKPVELKNECSNGHKGMYERDNRGVRFCRGCRRVENQKYYRRVNGTMTS